MKIFIVSQYFRLFPHNNQQKKPTTSIFVHIHIFTQRFDGNFNLWQNIFYSVVSVHFT